MAPVPLKSSSRSDSRLMLIKLNPGELDGVGLEFCVEAFVVKSINFVDWTNFEIVIYWVIRDIYCGASSVIKRQKTF